MSTVRRRQPGPLLVAAVCATGLGLVMFDNAAVTVALPAIRGGVHTSIAGLQWIVAAMSLAAATVLPLSGALGDRYGPRAVMRVGLALFGAGALGCLLSEAIGPLVAARAVQGLGAALMLPNGAALLAANVAGPARPRAVGAWITISSFGLAVGPLGGGLLVDRFGWRTIFLVPIPVVAAGIAGVGRLTGDPAAPGRRLDLRRLGASGLGLLLLCAGLIELGRTGRRVPFAAGCLAGAALLLGALVLSARRNAATSPLGAEFVDVGVRRRYRAVLAAALAYNGTVAGGIFVVSLLLQGERGLSPAQAGLVVLVATVGMPLGGQLTGRLAHRVGLRVVLVGAATVLAGAYLAVAVLATGPVGWLLPPLALTGIAAGALYSADTLAVLGAVDADRASSGLAALSLVRQVGAVLGVALLGAVSEVAGQLRISEQGGRTGLVAAGLVVLPAALLLLLRVTPRTSTRSR